MSKNARATEPGIKEVPGLVRELYSIVTRLEAIFMDRPFTPDGHLVGSLGEVLAAHHYGLKLLKPSAEAHDAIVEADGRQVQIKATQGDRVAFRGTCDFVLVLKLDKEGGFAEIYNGPGGPVHDEAGKLQRNGQRSIGLSRLRQLSQGVKAADRIRRVR